MTVSASAMTAAQLEVVQPGSRGSFRRRVMEAMSSLVPSPGAFFCFGTDDMRAYGDSSRVIDGQGAPVARASRTMKLTTAFGFELKSVVNMHRRAYLAEELYPEEERRKLPYFRDNSEASAFTQALLVFLHEGGVLFGLAGLERRATAAPFTHEDAAALEELAPFVLTASRSQNNYDELTREAASLRVLGKMSGSLYVVDRDTKTILWAANRQRGISWEDDVLAVESRLVDAAEAMYAAKTKGDALPTPPALPIGSLVSVARLENEPVFKASRCLVVRLEPTQEASPQALEGLSKREREIARLLIAGYSGVNVAAICALSENTVRTYVRRLYTKLDVSNRADLVRALVSPAVGEAHSSSAIAPPPDSALVFGEDILD